MLNLKFTDGSALEINSASTNYDAVSGAESLVVTGPLFNLDPERLRKIFSVENTARLAVYKNGEEIVTFSGYNTLANISTSISETMRTWVAQLRTATTGGIGA